MIRSITRLLGAVLTLAVLAGTAKADIIDLNDRNSHVQINTQSEAGMFTWEVDGVDQMSQQWFWFRIGSTGGETSLDEFDPTPAFVVANADLDPGNETATLQYSGNGLTITVTYSLTGGLAGSSTSDVAETIVIDNQTGQALDFHFFQYSDFDLGNTAGGDSVVLVNQNTVRQTGDALVLSETVVTPDPEHHELNTFPNTVTSLNDGSPTTLNDQNSAGPGDVTWAFQWDRTIANGSSFVISKDKNLAPVPEPSSLVLLAIGSFGSAFGAWRRRRTA